MKYLILPFFVFFVQATFAQKLPDVQAKSVFVSKPIKIDGKLIDWGDTFEAENKRTLIQYTISNDAKNLYLVLKTANMQNIQKIVNGGVTLSVNTEGKRNLKDTYALSYPIAKDFRSSMGGNNASNSERTFSGSARPAGGGQGGASGGRGEIVSSVSGTIRTIGGSGSNAGGGQGGPSGRRGGNTNPAEIAARRDSISRVNYKKTLADAKEIRINGFTSIQDSTLSIYNEYGVKVAASFDQAGHLVYELAIPLNLLALDAAEGKEFAYQLRINGISLPLFNSRSVMGSSVSTMSMETVSISYSSGGGLTEVDIFNPAEFWGKYKLVNK